MLSILGLVFFLHLPVLAPCPLCSLALPRERAGAHVFVCGLRVWLDRGRRFCGAARQGNLALTAAVGVSCHL